MLTGEVAWGVTADLAQPPTLIVLILTISGVPRYFPRSRVAWRLPEDFNIKEYFGDAWAVFRGDKTYKVEIRFTPEAAKIVTETVWHHTQKIKSHRDGSVTLTFHVDGLEEIRNWVLGWAGSAKVVKPTELCDLVVEKLQAALDMHRE